MVTIGIIHIKLNAWLLDSSSVTSIQSLYVLGRMRNQDSKTERRRIDDINTTTADAKTGTTLRDLPVHLIWMIAERLRKFRDFNAFSQVNSGFQIGRAHV